ncbi:hypothetical protein, partial [Yersinia bercovieri]|uniref:hypothetical protein n=1 Tax=Yersinia bercovieri TaxID=634 RepID=UPI00119F7D10
MIRWDGFDLVGEKIIKLFNEMIGISTVLAALFATLFLGFKKDPIHPILYLIGLATILLTVVVFRGYLLGITKIIPNDKISKTWFVFSFFSAGLMSC